MVAGEPAAPLSGPLTGLAPGYRLAGYQLEELVGVGGMAAVYRARDERLGRVVALKLLAGDEALRTRFVREARAVAAVDHPHIIPVYAAGEADGMQYIAMRFVPGDTLQGIVRTSGPLPPRRAASFISPIGSALDAAHAAGLVHRDVKPGNILVDGRPGRPEHPYLTDFGIARAMMSAGGLTAAGQFIGTPDYAAPEQINGQPVDGRADQYALGCVAYEVLAGAVPFRRESAWSVLYAHLNEPPPAIPGSAGLPPAAHQVLATGMAKSPGDRYGSCGEFADALREALGLEPYADPVPLPVPVPLPGPAPVPHPAPSPHPAPTPTLQITGDPGPRRPGAPTRGGIWTAVVTADRIYNATLSAVDDRDTASLTFPGELPERRIQLTGDEVRIGRRSTSSPVVPEIDLTGPPRDPGVSRLHAKLVAGPGDGWSVVNLGGANGITVNGRDVRSGDSVPLRPGDRLHLGAWTAITITRA